MPSRNLGSPEPGRIPFTWVSDDSTGHRYDTKQVRAGMTPVEGVELNWTDNARETKFFTGKGGEALAPGRSELASGDDTVAAKTAKKEGSR